MDLSKIDVEFEEANEAFKESVILKEEPADKETDEEKQIEKDKMNIHFSMMTTHPEYVDDEDVYEYEILLVAEEKRQPHVNNGKNECELNISAILTPALQPAPLA